MLKEAFIALVLERGYDQVSVEDITSRADVARATFYAHYARKEDLLTAVFSELVDDVMAIDAERRPMGHDAYPDGRTVLPSRRMRCVTIYVSA